MEPLWTKITYEMVDDLMGKICHTYKVEDNIHFLVNRTAMRDLLEKFVEQKLESYEFKE